MGARGNQGREGSGGRSSSGGDSRRPAAIIAAGATAVVAVEQLFLRSTSASSFSICHAIPSLGRLQFNRALFRQCSVVDDDDGDDQPLPLTQSPLNALVSSFSAFRGKRRRRSRSRSRGRRRRSKRRSKRRGIIHLLMLCERRRERKRKGERKGETRERDPLLGRQRKKESQVAWYTKQ